MKLVNPVLIQCKECGTLIEVDTDMECVDSQERSMGNELMFNGEVYDNCPNCDNEFVLELNVWEYPVGAINYQEEHCEGADIVEGPYYNPFDYDDFDI